jgi:hypothetical protein
MACQPFWCPTKSLATQVLLEAGDDASAVQGIARLMTCNGFDPSILQVLLATASLDRRRRAKGGRIR